MYKRAIGYGFIVGLIALLSFAAAVPAAKAGPPLGTKTTLVIDSNGEYLRLPGGSIDVTLQDPHSPIVDLFMHEHLGAAITLTAPTSIDDTTIQVLAGHGAVVGNLICLKENSRYYQATILSTTATSITLDYPLDYAYGVGAYCSATSKELAVDGSVTTEVFHIQPSAGVQWDITRIIIYIAGSGAMDSGTFGDIAALTKGILVRKKNGAGSTYNIFGARTNGMMANEAFDIAYDSKAPAGTTAVRVRRTFAGQSKNGVVVRLDGDLSEQLQILVQDDLTGIVDFNVVVQGHEVVD